MAFFTFFILLENIWFSKKKKKKKKNYIKELIKKSFENILNQVLQNFTYMQKRIIPDTTKTLQIELLPLLAAT